jgi:hypothetical protein
MDKEGPGLLRDLGSFEGLHPPFIELTLMSRRRAIHCLHRYRVAGLETGPRYQQNCTGCHKENARPVRCEPQESHAAPWRLQSVANRPEGIRAAKGTPPNSSARHVQDTAEKEQRAKPYQEHSGPLNLRLLVDHWLKLAIVDAKGTIRAQAKPTTNMPAVVTRTRSIDLGRSRPQIKSKCLERLSSRYV